MEGFSVIMPVYNQGTFIRRAILSLFAQSYTNWELILVNDGSTDQVEEYIVSVRKLYFLKKNLPNLLPATRFCGIILFSFQVFLFCIEMILIYETKQWFSFPMRRTFPVEVHF